MKIAIHHREGSFSDRWIAYCEEKKIDYKIVNAYSNDIVQQVEGCDAFMWHFHQSDYRDMQFAKALIMSLETKGIRCFPDSKTCWHFDNKVWEKYLLEAIGAPLVPSYVFYTKTEALRWARSTSFPKVFKLKGGASASNVRLARTRQEAVLSIL
jgi:glutathione synthase/RimK-type ligase-like ATP-grasp enzyme